MAELAKKVTGTEELKSKIVKLIEKEFYPTFIDVHTSGGDWDFDVEINKPHMTEENGDFYFTNSVFLNAECEVVENPEEAVVIAYQVGHIHDCKLQHNDLSVIYFKFKAEFDNTELYTALYELRKESWDADKLPTKLGY